MPQVEVKHGTFGWADLSTPDPAGAKEFYAGVLGWEYDDVPAGEHGTYTLCLVDGNDVAGMGQQPPEEVEKGVPPWWSSHVKVDDVDALTERAVELGGGVIMPPMDVMEAGRMSVIHDPTGAMICLWEARSHGGASLFNEHGAMCWNELVTRDREGAADFYAELFGWEFEDMEMPQGIYKVIQNQGRGNGGMLEMTDEFPAEMPSHWMVYFWVDDVDAAAERVKKYGGSLTVEPFEIGVGRMAVAADPQGAHFTLFKGEERPSE